MGSKILLPGASKRLEALSDGVFAIVATLLILEIHIPHFEKGISITAQWAAVSELMPSLIAFIFSFLNILIFWVNHDAVGKAITRYDMPTTYWNIFFLMCISIIPFTTGFISNNPGSFVAVAAYGFVLFLSSVVAVLLYYHLAFRAQLLLPEISMHSRKKMMQRIAAGPLLFFIAIFTGLINTYIPIIIYAITPLMFMALPPFEFSENAT